MSGKIDTAGLLLLLLTVFLLQAFFTGRLGAWIAHFQTPVAATTTLGPPAPVAPAYFARAA